MIKRLQKQALVALASSLTVSGSLWAQAEEAAAPAGKNYILCYFLVGLGVVLGLVVICRPGRRHAEVRRLPAE